MIKVAITGNIASGKSVVSETLENKGKKVLYTDVVAHSLLEDSQEVVECFQKFDIFEHGKISRAKLGKLVFADKIQRERLNAIIHPLIKIKILEFFEQNAEEDYVYVEIPLLFESGMEKLFDKIILVYADDEIRIARIMARNNCTREDAIQRINSQIPQEEKLKRVDSVIKNTGTIQDLQNQIDSLSCL